MKLGLKDRIQQVIDGYKANMKVQQDSIAAVIEPFKEPSYASRYTENGLKETIKEQTDAIISDWKKYNLTLNQQVKELIASARTNLFSELNVVDNEKERPADYAARIANARAFLQDELDAIYSERKNALESDGSLDSKRANDLDLTMHHILKDFIDDYKTMKLFKNMVTKKVITIYNADGYCIFPSTFGKLAKVEAILNALDDLDSASEALFIHQLVDGHVILRIWNRSYYTPDDGYDEIVDEEAIITAATTLDDLAEHIDEPYKRLNAAQAPSMALITFSH